MQITHVRVGDGGSYANGASEVKGTSPSKKGGGQEGQLSIPVFFSCWQRPLGPQQQDLEHACALSREKCPVLLWDRWHVESWIHRPRAFLRSAAGNAGDL